MNGKKFKQIKYLIVGFIIIIMVNNSFAQVNSSNVVTHDKITIVTNPKEGSNSFKEWGVFPAADKEIRRTT